MTAEDAYPERLLDLRGLRCPLPVLKLRKALAGARFGEALTVLCDDPFAAVDVPNFLRESGDRLLDASHEGGVTRFRVRRADGGER